jgi:hypothetical protein
VQTIALSLPSYDTLVENCRPSSSEYQILIGGSLVRCRSGHRFESIMVIECEFGDAQQLLTLANQTCPQAAQEIWTSLKLFRDK